MAYTRIAPQNITPGGTKVKQGFINDDADIKHIYSILDTSVFHLSGLNRNSVLCGSTSNGVPNFLTFSGLQGTLDGLIKPIILTFANGFDSTGTLDLIDQIITTVSNAYTLPASQTCYLYIEKDNSSGLLTYGYSLLQDLYQRIPPDSPTFDQHYFNTLEAKMYRWNDNFWEHKKRIFIAKAVTGSTSVTALTMYPFINPLFANILKAITGLANWDDLATVTLADLNALNTQIDMGTLFIASESTFSPPVRAGRNKTYNKIYIDCCDSAGTPQAPTSLIVTIYQNGSAVYTSPAITAATFSETIDLTISANDLIRAVVNNTTGLAGGVSISIGQVNR